MEQGMIPTGKKVLSAAALAAAALLIAGCQETQSEFSSGESYSRARAAVVRAVEALGPEV